MKAMAYEARKVSERLGWYLKPTVGLVDVNLLRVGCATSVEVRIGGVRSQNDVMVPLFETCSKSSRRTAACKSSDFTQRTLFFSATTGIFASTPAPCTVCRPPGKYRTSLLV